MKRQIQHPAPSERALSGPQYWRSLDELAATPEFQAQVEREFPEGASTLDGVNRRNFMKIDRKSTRLNSSHIPLSRMPSSA